MNVRRRKSTGETACLCTQMPGSNLSEGFWCGQYIFSNIKNKKNSTNKKVKSYKNYLKRYKRKKSKTEKTKGVLICRVYLYTLVKYLVNCMALLKFSSSSLFAYCETEQIKRPGTLDRRSKGRARLTGNSKDRRNVGPAIHKTAATLDRRFITPSVQKTQNFLNP